MAIDGDWREFFNKDRRTDAARAISESTLGQGVFDPVAGIPEERIAVTDTLVGITEGQALSFGNQSIGNKTVAGGISTDLGILPEAAGGSGTKTYGITSVPGLTLDPATRRLTANMTQSTGPVAIAYTVTDQASQTLTLNFTIYVYNIYILAGGSGADPWGRLRNMDAPAQAVVLDSDASLFSPGIPGEIAWNGTFYSLSGFSENKYLGRMNGSNTASVGIASTGSPLLSDAKGLAFHNGRLYYIDDDSRPALMEIKGFAGRSATVERKGYLPDNPGGGTSMASWQPTTTRYLYMMTGTGLYYVSSSIPSGAGSGTLAMTKSSFSGTLGPSDARDMDAFGNTLWMIGAGGALRSVLPGGQTYHGQVPFALRVATGLAIGY